MRKFDVKVVFTTVESCQFLRPMCEYTWYTLIRKNTGFIKLLKDEIFVDKRLGVRRGSETTVKINQTPEKIKSILTHKPRYSTIQGSSQMPLIKCLQEKVFSCFKRCTLFFYFYF